MGASRPRSCQTALFSSTSRRATTTTTSSVLQVSICLTVLVAYKEGKKKGRKDFFLFNDALSTFYLRLYDVGRNEGSVLFNDALNTFYLRLYGVNTTTKNTTI